MEREGTVVKLFLGFIVFTVLVGLTGHVAANDIERSVTGSVQLDYLAVATEDVGRSQGLDGATVELSLKMSVDFNDNVSSSVKVCVACHGLEIGLAAFDIRKSDLLNFRVGRFTPKFGNFPLRHDPANHRTSDKPLPYDMGRMLRIKEWNMSVLPAPWVDNGIEVSGTHFFGESSRFDYAVYAVGGVKGNNDSIDFDFIQSRSRDRYYVDNNSRPSLGARLASTIGLTDDLTLSVGASVMAGHYDPANKLGYVIGGTDLIVKYKRMFWRTEYLLRRTEMFIGDDPASQFKYGAGSDGNFDKFFIKDGFYSEIEIPATDTIEVLGRWDGMRRKGNVARNSRLRSESAILRYTAAMAYRLDVGLRIKASTEFYDFSDFEDELTFHLALSGPF